MEDTINSYFDNTGLNESNSLLHIHLFLLFTNLGIHNPSRGLSGYGVRSEQGGRASQNFHDFEAHSGSTQRRIGEILAALPPAQ